MATAEPTGTRYLYRQRRKYWARFGVPADIREAFEGKREHWVNLRTDHLRTAEARVHRAASDFHSMVREARGRGDTVMQDALHWHRQIEELRQKGSDEDEVGPGDMMEFALQAAADKHVPGGFKAVSRAAYLFHEGDEVAAFLALGGPKAKAFVDITFDGKKPLAPFVTPWEAVRTTEVEPKTAAMDKAAVLRFVKTFPLAGDVTKAAVADWIERRKADVSAASVQREVTGIRSFWFYLQTRGEVSEDFAPLAGLRFKDRRKDRASTRRVAFKAPEVSALYAAALKAEDQRLADLIALAAYTGARREELCALKVENVSWEGGGWVAINGAKTDAGNREVPIHKAAAPILRRLIGKRSSGFVFGGLDGDQWGHRGDVLGKRFTRLKVALGHGPDKTFHSIRHAFSQLMRGHDVTEDLIADLMGHKLATMTGGRYGSPAARRKLLPGALAKLAYPGALKEPK
jgi:integrase